MSPTKESSVENAGSHGREGQGAEVQDGDVLRLAIGVENYRQLAIAYGGRAARFACDEACRAIGAAFHRGCIAVPAGEGRLAVTVWKAAALGDEASAISTARIVESLQQMLASLPVRYGSDILHLAAAIERLPAVSADREPPVPHSDSAIVGETRFSGTPPIPPSDWARGYRMDMARAAVLFAALREGRITLAWQPVRRPADNAILYCEGLLRAVDEHGQQLDPAEIVPALERLLLVRPLDSHVVSRVLDELEADPHIALGVNISAQSAVSDSWWAGIEERLAAHPDIARRLVIEITETAGMVSISHASALVARMRALGCRIALDDFGAGYTSISQSLMLEPDIVKVDRSFLGRADNSERDEAVFQQVVRLAHTLAPVAIAEGVESDEHSRLARTAGIVWQQGFLFGKPSPDRLPAEYLVVHPMDEEHRGSPAAGDQAAFAGEEQAISAQAFSFAGRLEDDPAAEDGLAPAARFPADPPDQGAPTPMALILRPDGAQALPAIADRPEVDWIDHRVIRRKARAKLHSPLSWSRRTRRAFLVVLPVSLPLWLMLMVGVAHGKAVVMIGRGLAKFWSAPPRRRSRQHYY